MAQWFGPREPGFALGIRSWQGWVATALFIALLAGARFTPFAAFGLPAWLGKIAPLGVLLIFLSIVYWKYERD